MEEDKEPIITEPVRKSLLAVQLENLLRAQRKIFINRVSFIGEHCFDDKHEITKIFNEIRNQLPGTFTEQLSGILLYYDTMFSVLVEGADNDIHFIIQHLIQRAGNKLKRNKLLISIHHISDRIINNWISCNSNPPPSVTEKLNLDDNRNMETTIKHLRQSVEKLNSVAECYESGNLLLIDYMPEVNVLDYLLNSPYLETLTEFSLHTNQVQRTTISDQMWPASTLYMPYNFFERQQRSRIVVSNTTEEEEEEEEE